MPRRLRICRFTATAAATLWSTAALAQEPPHAQRTPAPLFLSDDVLNIRIEGPLREVFRERSQDPESFPATLRYRAPDGTESPFDIELRTRGLYRLKESTCSFPPLRVNFQKSAVEGTIFAGQDKLKLVTHCQNNQAEFEQNVLEEYLIYRVFNLVTDLSYRVRLAQITYVDADGRRDPITKYGFFLEDDDAMAARSGWDVLEVPVVIPEQMQPPPLALVDVFEYMIGNTDWDTFQPEPNDSCCHNITLVGSMESLTVMPVPYDFDWSGLVNARYAKPNPSLRLRSVRDRLYRGICRPREELEAALQPFRDQRAAVYELFRAQPGLDPRRVEDTVEYLDEFYRVVDDPALVEREIVRKCREP
jgi:hypothetical protein